MFGNRFSSSITYSRWRHEPKPGRLDQSRSCRFLKVATHPFSGDIVEEVKRLIRASRGVIVDLSEGKPNVLYEAGFAHALDKPTVHICSTPLSDLPFDIRNWNTVVYNHGQTTELREPLVRRLR